jgi:hypothetical protein
MIANAQTFTDIQVFLDGSTFTNCTFVRCELVYSGFLPASLSGNRFDGGCRWSLTGPALNTLRFMSTLHQAGGGTQALIENVFDSIRGKMKSGEFRKAN